MLDTLLLRTSLHFTQLHFTPLHYTCRYFTSSHLNFTQLHFTTFSFGSTPFQFPAAPFTSHHYTSLHCTSLLCNFRRFSPHLCSFNITAFIIAFLTLFLKILGLQGKVPNALVPVFSGPIYKGIFPLSVFCFLSLIFRT